MRISNTLAALVVVGIGMPLTAFSREFASGWLDPQGRTVETTPSLTADGSARQDAIPDAPAIRLLLRALAARSRGRVSPDAASISQNHPGRHFLKSAHLRDSELSQIISLAIEFDSALQLFDGRTAELRPSGAEQAGSDITARLVAIELDKRRYAGRFVAELPERLGQRTYAKLARFCREEFKPRVNAHAHK